MIKGAKTEGKLLIYSNMSLQNWKPVLEGFGARYPGVSVDLLDVGSRESIERYLAEASTGVATADLIATASQPGWIDMNRRGEIMNYVRLRLHMARMVEAVPGLYTVSADPLVFSWNALQLPEAQRPKTFAEFAAWRKRARSAGHKGHDLFSAHLSLRLRHALVFRQTPRKREGLEILEGDRGSSGAPGETGGPQIEKVTSGEYLSSFFMSGITIWPRMDDPTRAKFLGLELYRRRPAADDAWHRHSKASKNVNAAKLMLDYILSEEGQKAFGRGGLAPARPGIQPGNGIRATYSSVVEAVGEKNVILLGYDRP